MSNKQNDMSLYIFLPFVGAVIGVIVGVACNKKVTQIM